MTGWGKWSQCLYCVFSVEPEHQASCRPGWQPQLWGLSLHLHPMGLPSMGPARACCPCGHPLTDPPQQTTVVHIQQKGFSDRGRPIHLLIHFFFLHFLGIRHPEEFHPKDVNGIQGFNDGEPLMCSQVRAPTLDTSSPKFIFTAPWGGGLHSPGLQKTGGPHIEEDSKHLCW